MTIPDILVLVGLVLMVPSGVMNSIALHYYRKAAGDPWSAWSDRGALWSKRADAWLTLGIYRR